ncbi:MAG: hypothetical protein IIB31_09475 [Chloroflexi bacterium]|nr:hypothetical protein [Chloroflexota bacterium]MCH8897209.1 hypothetical protein [Chloroflexota bacterium]
MVDQLLLTAQVIWEHDQYLARQGELGLQGSGESIQQAQDDLVENLRAWIEIHEVDESLEQALADAGLPGLDDDTEIQLEFVQQ